MNWLEANVVKEDGTIEFPVREGKRVRYKKFGRKWQPGIGSIVSIAGDDFEGKMEWMKSIFTSGDAKKLAIIENLLSHLTY